MAFCPNFNSQEVKDTFNGIVEKFGAIPLSEDEFRFADLRSRRTGIDKAAMDAAYYIWDKLQGENIPSSRDALDAIILGKPSPAAHHLLGLYNKAVEAKKAENVISQAVPSEPSFGIQVGTEVDNSVKVLEQMTQEDTPYTAIAKQLLPYARKHPVQINVKTQKIEGGVVATYRYVKQDDLIGESVYRYTVDEGIDVENNEVFKRIPRQILIHEIVHSLTHMYLKDSIAKHGSRDGVTRLKFYAENYLRSQGILDQDEKPYGFETTDEFVAEFFANPEFAELLKNIPAMDSIKFRNLLEQLIDYITQLFKANTQGNLYEQVQQYLDGVLNAQREMEYQREEVLKGKESEGNIVNAEYISIDKTISNLQQGGISLQQALDMMPQAEEIEQNDMYQQSDEIVPESMQKATPQQVEQVSTVIRKWLNRMGISTQIVDSLLDEDGNVVDAIAKADLIEKIIQVVEGKADITTLPEEAFHFLIELLGVENPLVAKMMDEITKYEIYQQVLDEYSELYGGNIDKLKKEAIGKLLAQLLVQEITGLSSDIVETKTNEQKARNWFKRFWERVKQLFRGISAAEVASSLDPFREAIRYITDENMQVEDTALSGYKPLVYYQKNTTAAAADQKTVEQLLKDLKISYNPVTKEYSLNGKKVKYRVSDAVKRFYNRIFKNNTKEETPRSRMMAKKGTYLHALMGSILKAELTGTAYSKNDILSAARRDLREKDPELLLEEDSFFTLTDTQYTTLISGMRTLIKKINKKSDTICKYSGLQGKPIILNEISVYDESTDTAGTLDMLVIYPNGAVAIYDFKGINFFESKDHISELPLYKINGFDIQISGYKKALTDMFRKKGLDVKFAETRIIPINMQLKKGELIGNGFAKLEMETDSLDKKHLNQITVSEEYSSVGSERTITKTNNALKKIYDLRKRVLHKLHQDPYNERLRAEVEKLNSFINDILVRGSVGFAYKDLLQLYKNVEERIGFTQEHPNFMSLEEINKMMEYIHMYDDFTSNIEVERITSKEGKEKFKEVAYLHDKLKNLLEETLLDRMNDTELDLTKPGKQLGMLGRLFRTLSQIDHPAFRKLAQIVQNNFNTVHMEVEKDLELITKAHEELEAYVKSKGKSLQWGFDQIVNRKTGNLVSVLSSTWFRDKTKAREEKDKSWFLKHAEIKANPNGTLEYTGKAKTYFEKQKASYIKYISNAYSGDLNLEKRNAMITSWLKSHDISTHPEALYDPKNYFILSNFTEEYLTEGWKNLQKPENKALKDYYTMYTTLNEKYQELTGKKIDRNFIANIHKDLIDGIGETGVAALKDTKEYFRQTLLTRQADTLLGSIDQETGNPIPTVPYFFTQELEAELTPKEKQKLKEELLEKLKEKHSKEDRVAPFDENSAEFDIAYTKALYLAEREKGRNYKSYDLTRSMMLFAQASHTYAVHKETEAQAVAIIQLVKSKKVTSYNTDRKGEVFEESVGTGLSKMAGMLEEDIKVLEKFVNMYWYGHKTGQKQHQVKMFGVETSFEKLASTVMQFVSLKAIGLRPILAAGQLVNIKGNYFIAAKEGVYFNRKQAIEAHKLSLKRDSRYRAAVEFFGARANTEIYRKALHKSSSAIVRTINMDNAFFLHRKGDEIVEDNILISMMMNYGINKQGKVERLNKIKAKENRDVKSLFELSEVGQDGKLSIEGLSDDAFKQFRKIVIGVGRGIKGNFTEMDKSTIASSLVGAMLMHFKTWMQELGRQRFGNAEYDYLTEELFLPRFRVLIGDVFTESKSVWKEAGGLLLELAMIRNKKVNMAAAQYYFEKFKNANPTLQDVTFEEYLQIREAKLRGMLTELRIYLSFIAAVMFAKGFIPDDESKIKKQSAVIAYRMLNRSLLEFSFWFSPASVEQIIRFPIASFGILSDLFKVFTNGMDEMRDLIVGDSKYDKTPSFYYSSKLVPGLNSILDFVGYYETNVIK